MTTDRFLHDDVVRRLARARSAIHDAPGAPLTVSPAGQRDFEIILMPVAASPMLDEANAAKLRELVTAGKMGAGAFETDDCAATYAELSARGVAFRGPPQERPYGIEAVFSDDSGNWVALTQRK
jgi:hypothetical protein